jgi:hypothetical protein
MNVDALMHKLRQSRGRPDAIGSLQEGTGAADALLGWELGSPPTLSELLP